MFLSKNFVLANELVEHMGIHIANISMLRQTFEDNNDFYNIQKLSNCVIINSQARALPNNIRVGLSTGKFTDLSDKLPRAYVREEYDATERELTESGIVIDRVKICNKDFYVFNQEFVKTMNGCVGCVLDADETKKYTALGKIDGSIELSKNKYFTWYSI